MAGAGLNAIEAGAMPPPAFANREAVAVGGPDVAEEALLVRRIPESIRATTLS
jgi:hypothetical protein